MNADYRPSRREVGEDFKLWETPVCTEMVDSYDLVMSMVELRLRAPTVIHYS